jgi:Phosphopantetheinyl transferase
MGGRVVLKTEVPENLSDTFVDDRLRLLPSWRLEKALSYRFPLDRYLCAEAYLLLAEGLKSLFGVDGELEFGYSDSGKPFLKGHEGIHFNLSHCRRCVCCIVADHKVGIDVEEIQYDPLLAQQICNEEELAIVRSSAEPELEFTKLWTMKESLLKLTGEGLRDDLKDVLNDDRILYDIELNQACGYLLCSAEEITEMHFDGE